MHSAMESLARMWCRWAHATAMWPIHGQYRCAKCLRAYSVAWEAAPAEPHHSGFLTSGELLASTGMRN